MKKILLNRLRSLTAILVLNTVPVSFAETGYNYETEVLQARVLSDERKNSLNSKPEAVPLHRLYLENTLAYIQNEVSTSHDFNQLDAIQLNTNQTNALRQHQMTLALIEESYQEDYDDLLDLYEQAVSEAKLEHDAAKIKEAKEIVEEELIQLKHVRIAKIDEINQLFGIS